MKVLGKLAVFILLTPALLLAQTSTGQSATAPKANDTKAAAAQSAPSAAQNAGSETTGQKEPAAAQAAPAPKTSAPLPYPILSEKSKERARQLYDYFARGEMGPFYAAFAPEMKKQQPEAKLVAMSKQVTEKLGSPQQVLSENFLPNLGSPATIYSRTSTYSKTKVPFMVILAINGQGELADVRVMPVPPMPRDGYADYQDSTKLHLPFEGTWIVLQGGRNPYDNAFATSDDNRYTVSFMLLKDGMPFDNEGRKNSDYYCYGTPVLAPAAGVVVQMANYSPDHPPGMGTDMISRGNYVLIAHGNSEYSLIPYLKAGSVKLHDGQHVKQGEVIGECGNSGSSFAPHVEYSLQNTRGFPLPKTLPAQFVDYTADGKAVTLGEPLRGQMVANQPAPPATQTAEKPPAEKPQ